MSVCTSIEKVDTRDNTDLLRVTIDNAVTAYWFWDYSDSLQFLNQEVIVEYRKDVLDGALTQFVKTFTIPTVVNAIDREDNVKLYIDQEDNNSNFSFNDIKLNETKPGCVFYCTGQEYKSSSSAVWMELLIRDRLMRVAKLRIFDYDNPEADFAGHYVTAELTKSKFGFQTYQAVIAFSKDVPNPEIEIAENFIKNFFSTDVKAMEYINKLQLVENMKSHVDYEPGYGLVRLAMELAMCDSLKNITNVMSVQSVAHVLLTSYGYIAKPKSILSKVVNNVYLAQQVMFDDRRIVVTCLDECLEEHPAEYDIVKNIQRSVDAILRIRKGVE